MSGATSHSATLRSRFGDRALRGTVAWLLPSNDPRRWLDAIVGWNVPQAALRLYSVPRSAQDRRPNGCLAIVEGSSGTSPPAPCPSGIPYGVVAERLYLPVEAGFDPDLSPAELRGLLEPTYTYLWHPTAGLIAAEPSEALRVSDLLTVSPPRQVDWGRAIPGIALARRLVTLEPELDQDFATFMAESAGDISTESDHLQDLSRSPEEPSSNPLSTLNREGLKLLAGMAQWFAQQVPRTSDQPTWINSLENWAQQQLAGVSRALDATRHRELLRLLHLLATDPDRGLRFALPLHGDAHRGLAPPSDRLAERNTDFNLGRLGGGRPTDFWNLPGDYQLRLTQRYRELANRELALGRHRRAAYIFAELLGDFAAAAAALEAGHHFREAAALHRQRLHRPLDAARCLERGGLLPEAIALYRELNEHEKAGDLYVALEQTEAAVGEYRRAVEVYRGRKDIVSVARMLEEKLRSPDEALAALTAGWPHATQAGDCLRGMFRLLGRLGRHEASLGRVREFRRQSCPTAQRPLLAEILAETAGHYPDRRVQQAAADGVRVIAAHELPAAAPGVSERLLAAVDRLAREDRLLSRDCQRYLQRQRADRSKPAVHAAPAVKRRPTQRLSVVREIALPAQVTWAAFTYCRDMILAAGDRNGQTVLARCDWEGTVDATPLPSWQVAPHLIGPRVLAIDPVRDSHLLVHVVGGPVLWAKTWPATDAFAELRVGAVAGMDSNLVAAARCEGKTWYLVRHDSTATLVGLGPTGVCLVTRTVPLWHLTPTLIDGRPAARSLLYARPDKVYVACADQVLAFGVGEQPTVFEFDAPIHAIQGSLPATRPRIAVSLEVGARLIWDDGVQSLIQPFAQDLPQPMTCINRGGYVVALAERTCEVYRARDRQLELAAQTTLPNAQPLAILPGPTDKQFGIAFAGGRLALYEVG